MIYSYLQQILILLLSILRLAWTQNLRHEINKPSQLEDAKFLESLLIRSEIILI